MKPSDRKLDDLIAESLGGPAYNEVLREMLARTVVREMRRRRRSVRWFLLPLTVAAAVGAFLLYVRWPSERRAPVAAAGTGAIQMACPGADDHACRVGETLVFTVNGALAAGYLGAYAEAVDLPRNPQTGSAPPAMGSVQQSWTSPDANPSRPRIWYFPDASGSAPFTGPGRGPVAALGGIRLGAEHRPGRYRVTAWISNRPVARRELDAPPADLADLIVARASLDLEVRP